MKKSTFEFNVHDIVEMAMLCALALILDNFLKIPLASTGGSINLAALPLMFIALRHGWFKAFISCGLVYAFLSCLIDGYGFACLFFDYIVAFGSIGFVGVFAKYVNSHFTNKGIFKSYLLVVSSIVLWAVIRFFACSIDSVILYQYTFKAAFVYNFGYVFISALAVCIATCALLPLIIKLNKVFKTSFLKD